MLPKLKKSKKSKTKKSTVNVSPSKNKGKSNSKRPNRKKKNIPASLKNSNKIGRKKSRNIKLSNSRRIPKFPKLNPSFNASYRPSKTTGLSSLNKKSGIFFNEFNKKNGGKKSKSKSKIFSKKSKKQIKKKPVKIKSPSSRFKNRRVNQGMMVSGSKMFQMRKSLAKDVFSSLGYKSIAGMSEGVAKLNQDCIYVDSRVLQDPNVCLLGVMDGHGMQGHRVSGFLRLNVDKIFKIVYDDAVGVPKSALERQSHSPPSKPMMGVDQDELKIKLERLSYNLNSASKRQSVTANKDDIDLEKMMFRFCLALNQSLVQNRRINSGLSGSTGVFMLFYHGKIVIANVGDSRAIFLMDKSGNLSSKQITNDHTPDIPSEKKRILQSGGCVKPFRRPPRVWKRGKDMPGLMMTRSFGDQVGHQCGVICEPEIHVYNWDPSIVAVAIASDGIWEKIPNKIVAKMVEKHYYEGKNGQNAAEDIVKRSVLKWKTVRKLSKI